MKNLAPYGYTPAKQMHDIWKHKTRPINFTLVVDDFGVTYTNKADALHLINALEKATRSRQIERDQNTLKST